MRFGFTGNSTIISTWSKNLGQWWYILFTTIGTALTSISASFINNNYDLAEKINSVNSLWTLSNFAFHSPYTYLAAGIASIFYGSRGTYNDQKNLNEINEQLKSENLSVERLKKKIDSIAEDSESLLDKLAERHTKLVEMWLKLVSKNLKLGSYDRVSIYYHVKEHFYLLARYSINPEFDKINRQKFPTKYGVISQAWQHKSCVDTMKCPEYGSNPQDYTEYMNDRYGYNDEKIDRLIMKSCEFVAMSISDADRHIGVIVFETIKSNRFKEQKIREIKKYCNDYQSYLCSFIRDGISLDKSAKVIMTKNSNTERDFLSLFAEGNHE